MVITPVQSFRVLDSLRQQMEQLFDDMLQRDRGFTLLSSNRNPTWTPAIKIQEEEHLQQSMLSRLEAEINTPVEPENQQEAREVMAHRQHEKHLQESILSRSVAEVGIPVKADSSSQEQS